MRKYSIVLVMVLQMSFVFGQIGTGTPQITRPNPTVASLMNFNETPVNTFTGTPDINVPLYSFPTYSKDINLNLSLNYHPAGISYLNKASDVGVGWNLFAGGVVSRMVINDPDGWNTSVTHPEMYQNFYDDVYSFNFLGYSGEFQILKNTTNPVSFTLKNLSSTNVKIEYVMNTETENIDSFTIYDDKGYKYVFDQFDNTDGHFYISLYDPLHANPSDPEVDAYIGYRSAHHLSKVYDNNGKLIIDFDYINQVTTGPLSYETKKLNEITVTGFGKVSFTYEHFTEAEINKYNDGYQLNEISIQTLDDIVIKRFVFTYSYIGPVIQYQTGGRRTMTKVNEFGAFGTESLEHSFTYKGIEDNGWPWCSENKLMLGWDGYLHSVHKRINLEPGYFVDSTNDIPWLSTSGVLSKITLPTGGTIVYEFEPHTYAYPIEYENATSEYTQKNPYNTTDAVCETTIFDTTLSSTYTFTVTGSVAKKLFFRFNHQPYYNANHTDPLAPLEPDYTITGPNSFSYDFRNGYDYDVVGYQGNYYSCLGKLLELEPGTYTINIGLMYSDSNTTGGITIYEKVVNSPLQEYFYAEGCRIKRIQYSTDNSNFNTVSKEINYDYADFNNPNKSSGIIYRYLGFQRNLPTTDYISYHNVRVYDNGTNGFTKYTYYNYLDYISPTTTDPFLIDKYFSYQKGLLKKKEVFNNLGYPLLETNITHGFYTDVNGNVWSSPITNNTKNFFYPNGISIGNILEKDETFEYNLSNKQISLQTVSNSKGETLKTKYYYHTGNSTGHQNRISEIEKIETYRNAKLLNTSKIDYSNAFSGNASYLPQTIQASKGTASLENRVKYNLYDEFGHPLEVQQENGTLISYIWGYNKTQPIAKIENMDYGSIPALTITNLQTKSDADDDHCTAFPCTGNEGALLNALEAFQAAFPHTMITYYTYDPLIGVTSITDPKGDRQTFTYDSFGRLQSVKDNDGKLLSENEYHYRTQN